MIRAFIASSVFFTACISIRGASRAIIELAIQRNVWLVISKLVLQETEKNLSLKAPTAIALFHQFVDAVPFILVHPTKDEVIEAAAYTVLKDAPIVAAAKSAQVDYLASLDRRHLVGNEAVSKGSGLKIVLPDELLRHIREQLKNGAGR